MFLSVVCRCSPEQSATHTPFQTGGRTLQSLDEVYRRRFFDVCRWARAMGGLHTDIEEITQEVFLIVRRELEQVDVDSPSWLYRITREQVRAQQRRMRLRRLLRSLAGAISRVLERRAWAHARPVTWEGERQLADVLERMSLVRRAAFVLYEFEGYSREEIARLEAVSTETVQSRLSRARKDFVRLARALRHEEWESA